MAIVNRGVIIGVIYIALKWTGGGVCCVLHTLMIWVNSSKKFQTENTYSKHPVLAGLYTLQAPCVGRIVGSGRCVPGLTGRVIKSGWRLDGGTGLSTTVENPTNRVTKQLGLCDSKHQFPVEGMTHSAYHSYLREPRVP